MECGKDCEKKIDAQIKTAQAFGLDIDRARAVEMVERIEKSCRR